MNEYLKQAIVIMSEDQDWKKVCTTLAINYPKLFCEMVDIVNKEKKTATGIVGPFLVGRTTGKTKVPSMKETVLDIYSESENDHMGILAAVEYIRNEYNCTLSQARDIVNNIIHPVL